MLPPAHIPDGQPAPRWPLQRATLGHRSVVIIGAGYSGVAAAAASTPRESSSWCWSGPRTSVGSIGTVPSPTPSSSARRSVVVHERGLLDRFRFWQEVLDATWDAEQRRWTIRTARLQVTANVLVDASGAGLAPRPADLQPCYVGLVVLGRVSLSTSSRTCQRGVREHLARAS
jgi:hypothetical protein